MAKNSKFKLDIEAKLENLGVISSFVSESLRRLGVDSVSIPRILLAVDEACTNVAMYAYPPEQPGLVRLSCGLQGSDIIVTIEDKGKPFDPCSHPTPKLDAELYDRSIGGLGIYLMRKVMDEMSYRYDARRGNQLTMKKRVGASAKAN